MRGLVTEFALQDGSRIRAVDDISLSVERGQVLGLVGESGSGKSVTALSIGGLIRPPGRIAAGEVFLAGTDLRQLGSRDLRKIRAEEIGFVFQDPHTSLNPVMSIGDQVLESLRASRRIGRKQGRDMVAEMLASVGIVNPQHRYNYFPHQFSGGMRQRVMLAMALIRGPRLLIADEPTTALDVTVQAQILRLLRSAVDQMGLGMVLITHDFGVASSVCDRVAVMYAGQIVEVGPIDTVIRAASHPYTRGLIAAIPSMTHSRGEPLPAIPRRRSSDKVSKQCRFTDRCPFAREVCSELPPQLERVRAAEHDVRCHGVGKDGWVI